MKIKNIFLVLCSFMCVSLASCSKTIDEDGYRITWKDSNGTVLAVQHDVQEGTIPHCPTGKPADKSSRKRFIDWSPKVSTVTGNATYTAVYDDPDNPTEYNIYYFGLEDAENNSFNQYYFTFKEYVRLFEPYKEGYTFEGWTDQYGKKVTVLDTYRTKPIEVYANWSIAEFDVSLTYYPRGIGNSQTITYSYGEYAEFYAPTISGYTFDSWYINGSYSYDQRIGFKVTSNVYLEAYYKANPTYYTVTYQTNISGDGYGDTIPCEAYTHIHLSAPERTGYEFIGWYEDDLLYSSNPEYSYYVTRNVTLIARYEFIYKCDYYPNGYIITGYFGTYTNIEIPTYHNGVKIIGIADNAFKGNSTIRNVVIPETIETIGAYAFANTQIQSFVVAEDSALCEIGAYCFSGCDCLTNVDLSETQIEILNNGTFCDANNLISISLPETLTTICENAFCNIYTTIYVYIPENVTYVEASGFNNCSSMTIVIQNSSQTSSWDSNWNLNVYRIIYNS